MIKHSAQSVLSRGKDDVEKHMCQRTITNSVLPQHAACICLETQQEGEQICFFVELLYNFDFCQLSFKNPAVHWLPHASRHRRTLCFCLTSLEGGTLFQLGSSQIFLIWQQKASKMQVWVFLCVVAGSLCHWTFSSFALHTGCSLDAICVVRLFQGG